MSETSQVLEEDSANDAEEDMPIPDDVESEVEQENVQDNLEVVQK